MPISSPSYFPPQRSIDRIVGLNAGLKQTGNRVFLAGENAAQNATSSDLIVIGDDALSGIPSGYADNIPGTIVIGSGGTAGSLTNSNTSGYSAADGAIIIGYGMLPNTASANGSVIIGANSFAQLKPQNASGDYGGINGSVVIGTGMMNGATALTNPESQISDSVIIGYAFNYSNSYWTGISSCVIIGANIANTEYSNSFSNTVAIGYGCCASGMPTDSVIIGGGAGPAGGSGHGACSDIVAIGYQAGSNIVATNGGTFLGYQAGESLGDVANMLDVRAGGYSALTGVGNPHGTGGFNLIFNCGGALGNAQLATAVGIFCLMNGTKGTANPTGGGYFYVTGGVLHWVDSSGVDTQVSVSASGQLASSSVGYTNNAAAAAGTLTNAPAAGNPTKWIPINDNGTIRNIPAW
jgi:hypothetical protein